MRASVCYAKFAGNRAQKLIAQKANKRQNCPKSNRVYRFLIKNVIDKFKQGGTGKYGKEQSQNAVNSMRNDNVVCCDDHRRNVRIMER